MRFELFGNIFEHTNVAWSLRKRNYLYKKERQRRVYNINSKTVATLDHIMCVFKPLDLPILVSIRAHGDIIETFKTFNICNKDTINYTELKSLRNYGTLQKKNKANKKSE